MNQTTNICLTAEYLFNSASLETLIIYRTLITVLGICLMLFLLLFQGTYLALHKNARFLLIAHHITAIQMCAGYLFIHIFDLSRFFIPYRNPCDYMITMSLSVLLRTPNTLAVYGNVFAFFSLAIERCYATVHFKTYENNGPIIRYPLIVLQVFIAITLLFLTAYEIDWTEMKAYSTLASKSRSKTGYYVAALLIVVEIGSLAIFIGLLRFNRWKQRQLLTEDSLTEKYQVNENIKSIKTLIPMVFIHFTCFMSTLLAFPIYLKINTNVDPRDYTFFQEIFNFFPYYCIILPVFLFQRHKTLRKMFRRALYISVSSSNEASSCDADRGEQDRHFELLQRMWA